MTVRNRTYAQSISGWEHSLISYYLALDIVVCLPGVPEKKYHGSTGIFY